MWIEIICDSASNDRARLAFTSDEWLTVDGLPGYAFGWFLTSARP